jgi:tape measure domain-containing protein
MSLLNITLQARDRMSAALDKSSRAVGVLSRKFSGLRGALAGAFAGFTGFQAAASFIDANASLEQMRIRLEAVTGSVEQAEQSFEWIREFQKRYPVRDIQSMTQAFIDLVQAGINPTTGAFKDLIAGSAKFGLTVADIRGVTRALRQMTALTNAQKQELNQLVERIPGLTARVAEIMNMSQQELLEGIRRMQVDSRDLAAATLNAMGSDADDVLNRFSNTYEAGIAKIKTAWFELMVEIGNTGAFDAVKEAIKGISNLITNFNNSVIKTMGENLFNLGKSIFDMFGNIFDAIGDILTINTRGSALENMNRLVIFMIAGFKTVSAIIKNIAQNWSAALANMKAKWGNFQDYISESTGGIITGPTKKAQKEIDELSNKIRDLGIWIEKLDEIDGMERTANKWRRELSDLKKELLDLSKKSTKSFSDSKKALDNNDFAKQLNNDLKSINKEFNDMLVNSSKVFKKLERDRKRAGLSTPNEIQPIAQIGKTKDVQERLKKNLETSKSFSDGWNNALETIRDKSHDVFNDVEVAGQQAAKATVRAFETGLTNLFDNIIEGKVTKFRDLMLNVIKDIAKQLARLAAQQAAQGIAQGIGNIFSNQGTQTTYGDGTGGTTASGGANTAVSLQKASNNAALRQKAGGQTNMKVEVINQSGELVQATQTETRQEFGVQIMSIVLDSVRTNRNGSRDALKAGLS